MTLGGGGQPPGVYTGSTIELGSAQVSDTATFIDFHARAGSDFDARIIREGGVNGALDIRNEGTGGVSIFTNGINRRFTNGNGDVFSTIPGGSTIYPDFACRAWGYFQGNGQVSGAGNATIARIGVGAYRVIFSTPMPDTNYAIVSCSEDTDQSGNARSTTPLVGSRTTTAFTLYGVEEGSGSAAIDTISNFSVFR
jgi:hypothetical protein